MDRAFALLVALAVATALACGRGERAAGDKPVTIIATDSGYVAPDTLYEGLNHIAFENHGSSIHECMFIRLPDDMSAAQYIAAVDSGYDFPVGAIDCSGAGLTSPLERVELWLPLDAGRYLLACWFRGHLTHIPPTTIVVHGQPRVPVIPPYEDATLKEIDFRYELSGQIHAGAQTIRVETVGPSMHEVDCFRLEGGRAVKDLNAWYANDKKGSPFATAMGGALDHHDLSRVVWFRRNFTMGHYVFWCDMPMIQSGTEAAAGAAAHVTHAQAGMVLEFEVSM
jgi:hypothetical protein